MEKIYDIEKSVYKNSEMAILSLEEMLKNLETKDNKIKDIANEVLKDYKRYLKESEVVLIKNKIKIETKSAIPKMGISVGIKKEIKKDNSDSAMANMLIQGITMGALNIEKNINNYEHKVDKKSLDFGKKFCKFEDDVIFSMKKFL